MAETYSEVRALARTYGINVFQKSKTALKEEITAAEASGVQPELPAKSAGATWTWRNRFDVDNKDPNFRYRFVDRDETNLREKMSDGWEFVNPDSGIPGEHVDPRQVADGGPLEGAQTYRDMVLMALPEEKAKARDAAVAELTRQQTVGLKKALQDQLRNPDGTYAEVHGKITIIE